MKRGVLPFWDLLDLLASSDLKFTPMGEVEETESSNPDDVMDHFTPPGGEIVVPAIIPCLCCDEMFGDWESVQQHVIENHKS